MALQRAVQRPDPDAVVAFLNASNPPRLSLFATRIVISAVAGEVYELTFVNGAWKVDVWTPPVP